MSASRAYVVPFIVFLLFLALCQWIGGLGRGEFYFDQPRYWVYPLQTIVCAVLLSRYWRRYNLRPPQQWVLTLGIGILVLGIWVSPQVLFGAAKRVDGFDPTVFPPGSGLYWGSLLFRFIRLVVIVPLVEEIFWRGFLLRYLVNEDFESVPFGTFTWLSFGVVTLGFAMEHNPPDWVAALTTGVFYNWLAIRTRSLSSCVLAHAVTNLVLGFYVLQTRQWGFW